MIQLGQKPETMDRDAIHVACIACVAAHTMRPGERVRCVNGKAHLSMDSPHGIVDPFLSGCVETGETFYMCLMPGTVVGMRHEWEHPDFPRSESHNISRHEAKCWLEEQAEQLGCPFEHLVEEGGELETGEYILTGLNEDARDHWYEICDEFWKYHEAYTGRHTKESDRGGFTCSC